MGWFLGANLKALAAAAQPNAFSSSLRTASDREGFGSGCASIQAATAAWSSAGIRTERTGSLPVAGRPRRLFGCSAI